MEQYWIAICPVYKKPQLSFWYKMKFLQGNVQLYSKGRTATLLLTANAILWHIWREEELEVCVKNIWNVLQIAAAYCTYSAMLYKNKVSPWQTIWKKGLNVTGCCVRGYKNIYVLVYVTCVVVKRSMCWCVNTRGDTPYTLWCSRGVSPLFQEHKN